MYYFNLNGTQISSLGFGLMRLPLDKFGNIRLDEARLLLDYAINNGVNYFETARSYHNKTCEKTAYDLLSQYPRDKYLIVMKNLNPYAYKEDFDEQRYIFHTNVVDFFLLHGIRNTKLEFLEQDGKYYIENPEMINFYAKQRDLGNIRHLGFSSHMTSNTLELFLNKFGSLFEFILLQLNYYDWNFIDVQKLFELAYKYNLPIWVMESVRGGALCNLPKLAENILHSINCNSIASWGYRWLQTIPNVKVILSGMSSMSLVVDNINTFNTHNPLTEEQFNYLITVGKNLILPTRCTGCGYCKLVCPLHNDIPNILKQLTLGKELEVSCLTCDKCREFCPLDVHVSEFILRYKR